MLRLPPLVVVVLGVALVVLGFASGRVPVLIVGALVVVSAVRFLVGRLGAGRPGDDRPPRLGPRPSGPRSPAWLARDPLQPRRVVPLRVFLRLR
jgi:hypothetical protein